MATAESLRKEFMDYMDSKGVKYSVFSEDDNIVHLSFGGEKDTFVLADFDEAGNDASSVHFVSQNFAKAEKQNIPAALVRINDINKSYRWVKFYIAEDGAISADADADVFPGTVGEECTRAVFRMSTILEEALDRLEGVAKVDEETMQMLRIMAVLGGLR